jgi:Trk-type K+ transport systems, membrane components
LELLLGYFFYSSLFSFFFGTCFFIVSGGPKKNLNVFPIFFLTRLSWLTTALISALPFYLGGLAFVFTDAFFVSISGFPSTGSTFISGLVYCSPGILLWGAMLLWFGGIGFVVLAIAVLPGF